MEQDYVVAITNATGKAHKVWPGQGYRSYNPKNTTQYRIYMASSPQEAIMRAEFTHREQSTVKGA